jgi:hypothetical protein
MAFFTALAKGLVTIGREVGTAYLANQISEKRNKSEARAAAQAARTPLTTSQNGGGGIQTPRGRVRVTGGAALPLTFSTHAQIHERGLAPVYGGRRRRRMNYGNTKALTRALRRAEGFTRLVKRTEKAIRRISPTRRSRTVTKKVC